MELIKAREVKFDACIKSPHRRARETISPASTENEDEDEKTNRIASKRPTKTSSGGRSQTPQYPLSPAADARRPHSTGSETDSSDGGVDLPPGCWVVDGDVTNMSSVEIRFVCTCKVHECLCVRTCACVYRCRHATLCMLHHSSNSLQAAAPTTYTYYVCMCVDVLIAIHD